MVLSLIKIDNNGSPAKKVEGLEVKGGHLLMVQRFNNRTFTTPVFVRVYRSRFEHYAVIVKDQKFSNSSVYMSLKHCQVTRNNTNEITIVADNVEGNKVTFEIRSKLEEEEWMCAFTPVLKQRFIVLDRSKMYSMPSLSEEDES
jgi:hypothetical protein